MRQRQIRTRGLYHGHKCNKRRFCCYLSLILCRATTTTAKLSCTVQIGSYNNLISLICHFYTLSLRVFLLYVFPVFLSYSQFFSISSLVFHILLFSFLICHAVVICRKSPSPIEVQWAAISVLNSILHSIGLHFIHRIGKCTMVNPQPNNLR